MIIIQNLIIVIKSYVCIVLGEMHEKILIKTWEMLSHRDYYSLLSKMTVYSWLYLIMKENDGDVNSAMNMIVRGNYFQYSSISVP